MPSHLKYPGALSAAVSFCLTFALTPAFAADFPVGSYAPKGGTTTLTFDEKGQFRVVDKDAMVVTGQYTIKGDQLEITDMQGPWACTKPQQKTGTYAWKVNKSELIFSTVADTCQDRVQSLTMTKWERKK
jgi:hypothetical protein